MEQPDSENPTLSIVIPARNEQEHLPRCLSSIEVALSGTDLRYEIIVVLNRCTDRTEAIARSRNCRIVFEDAKNLAKIRNSGARAARGEILVTVDADSRVSANMFIRIQTLMQSPNYIGGGVLILPERISLGIFVSALLLLPIALFYRISAGLFFLRRSDFIALQGFDETLVSAEDIDFAKRLRRHGALSGRKYAVLLRAYIVTSCRKFDVLGDWYFVRNFGQTLRLLRGRDQAAADTVWYDFGR